MEPKYKLTYFNGRGLAEVSRLILAYAEVDYIDERLSAKQWANMKSFMFMRLPMLSFDDVTIRESRAIARFLAREHGIICTHLSVAETIRPISTLFNTRQTGLVGKDNIEAAKCDMLVDEFYDIYPEINKWRRDGLVGKLKQNLTQDFVASVYPEFLKRFSHLLHVGHPKGTPHHFVGNQLTWADIALAHGFWELMKTMEPHVQPSYYDNVSRHIIVEFVDQILSIPSIKAWIDKRPKTEF